MEAMTGDHPYCYCQQCHSPIPNIGIIEIITALGLSTICPTCELAQLKAKNSPDLHC